MDDMFIIRDQETTLLAVRMPNDFFAVGTVSKDGIPSVYMSKEQVNAFCKWVNQQEDNNV